MSNANLPYRVIYLKFGKITTRVFGNLAQAQQFVSEYPSARIQLASEQPDYPSASRKFMDNARVGERLPCKCGMGNRLRSESCCYKCAPILSSNKG